MRKTAEYSEMYTVKKECESVNYTKLGNSDLMVSRICMGCMGFGDANNGQHSWTLDEERSREIISRGIELGVNFLTQLSPTRAGPASGMWDVHCGILRSVMKW